MARFGFFVRGVLYIVIALLVFGTGRTEDLTGAMEYLGRGAGHWLVALMIVGMLGYGLWRMSDAIFGMDSGTEGAKAWRHRAAAAASGTIYLFLAYKALRSPPVRPWSSCTRRAAAPSFATSTSALGAPRPSGSGGSAMARAE